jgi:hypothetical protein
MRVVLHEYADGGRYVYETTDDGSELVSEWLGPRKVGQRVSAYAEVGYQENGSGLERLLQAMDWLAAEIKKRKETPVQV